MAADKRTVFGLVPVVFLPGNGALGHQGGPSGGRHFGQVLIRLAPLVIGHGLIYSRPSLLESGPGLTHLLIHLGGVDFGQRLAGVDTIPDIHHPALQVSIGARQDGGLRDGLNAAGQLNHVPVRGTAYLDDLYALEGPFLVVRFPRDQVPALHQRPVPGNEGQQDQHRYG